MFFQPPTPNSRTRAAQRPTSTVSWSSKILLRIHGKFMIHHHARLMVANPDPLHFSCFAPQDARPGIESRLMGPGGGEVSLDLYMLTKASAAVARARQASAPHSPAARSIPFLYFEREPSGEPRCDMNSKGGPVHVAAWRGDALVVKVWERVGASNARWCRPFLYL